MRPKAMLLFVTVWFLLLKGVWATAAEKNQMAVIVANSEEPLDLTRNDLALIYKRKMRIHNGLQLKPVNLPVSHSLRQYFSQQVLHHSPEEMEDYWRSMYFNGVLPPHVQASEEAVIRFVATTPGAIGYVAQCLADRRVTTIMLIDGGPACPK